MGKRVLIVDDEPDLITFLSTLLEDNGYETIAAADGDEGLDKIRSEKPDLISLDLLMPNKTGIKLYRELRRDPEIAHIPVIMCTGLQAGDVPQMDFEKWIRSRSIRPPDAYICKPVDTEVYLAEVKKAIG